MKTLKSFIYPFLISLICYLYFFYPLLNPQITIYSGKDALRYHYASRFYLYDELSRFNYPFWTERIFLGYPIYSDLERGYQNILNLILVYTLGPILSFKILHFIFYLLGSVSLYLLIKRHGGGYLVFIASNLLYFFSFFSLIQQQHFDFVWTFYSIPLLIILSIKFIDTKNLLFLILNSFLIYLLFTFGATQANFIAICLQIIYLLSFYPKNKVTRFLLINYLLTFIICLPSFISFLHLFSLSLRSSTNLGGQGNLDLNNFYTLLYPFIFGMKNYAGETLNSFYVKNEFSLYLGIVALITSFFSFISTKNTNHRRFSISLVTIFLITNLFPYPPFSFFRYWVRAEIFLLFLQVILISEFYKNIDSFDYKRYLKFGLILFLPIISLLFNKPVLYLLKNSISESFVIPIVWALLILFSSIFLFINKFRKYIFILIIIDILFFTNYLPSNMFMNVNSITYEPISENYIINTDTKDELTLYKNRKSVSGYVALEPNGKLDFNKELDFFNFIQKMYLVCLTIYIGMLILLNRFKDKIL